MPANSHARQLILPAISFTHAQQHILPAISFTHARQFILPAVSFTCPPIHMPDNSFSLPFPLHMPAKLLFRSRPRDFISIPANSFCPLIHAWQLVLH
jgi:hypothetical protein